MLVRDILGESITSFTTLDDLVETEIHSGINRTVWGILLFAKTAHNNHSKGGTPRPEASYIDEFIYGCFYIR
jgi:hypothetical protein